MPAVYGIKESKMLQKKKIYIYIYIYLSTTQLTASRYTGIQHKVTVIYELCVLLLKFAY